MKYLDITALDSEILNSLSDDYESIEQIHKLIETADFKGDFSLQAIFDRIGVLFENNYFFLTLNKTFSKSKVKAEISGKTQLRPYWFGRTEKSYKAWKDLTRKYYKALNE